MVQHTLKIIWAQKWKYLPVAKVKGKTCFRWSAFMIDYISAYQSQMTFMALDRETDKPRMNVELRVMMTEL